MYGNLMLKKKTLLYLKTRIEIITFQLSSILKHFRDVDPNLIETRPLISKQINGLDSI